MASVQAGSRAVDRQIRALFALGAAGDLTDQELLRRFATKGDESAFEALVSRHGPMVFRVCRGRAASEAMKDRGGIERKQPEMGVVFS
jgi:hypothetical protein